MFLCQSRSIFWSLCPKKIFFVFPYYKRVLWLFYLLKKRYPPKKPVKFYWNRNFFVKRSSFFSQRREKRKTAWIKGLMKPFFKSVPIFKSHEQRFSPYKITFFLPQRVRSRNPFCKNTEKSFKKTENFLNRFLKFISFDLNLLQPFYWCRPVSF